MAPKTTVGEYAKLPENSGCTCPDFKVPIGTKIVGIEITQIPELSREATKKFIAEQKFEREVIRLLTEADLPGTIHFNLRYQQTPDFRGRKLSKYAEQLGELFLNNIEEGHVFINLHSVIPRSILEMMQKDGPLYFLPEGLQSILAYAFMEYRKERMYDSPVIYFPGPDTSIVVSKDKRKKILLEKVEQKNGKHYNECRHVDEVWLVMRNREEWTFADYDLPKPDLSSYKTFKRIYAITGYEGIAKRNGKDNPEPKIQKLK